MQNTQYVRYTQNMQQPIQKKNKKSIIGILLIVLVIIVVIIFAWKGCAKKENAWVCKDGEWVADGKVKTPKPETACVDAATQEGSKDRVKPSAEFIEMDSVKPTEGIDIRIFSPHVNETVTSPLKITGEAKGWFVDQKILVQLIDENGNVLTSTEAKAGADGEEYTSFDATIEYDKKGAKAGDLVFQKVNPTNNPAEARTFSFPVFFE